MGNAPSVGDANGICQSDRQVEKLIEGQPGFRNHLVQALPLHEFHCQEPDPVGLVDAVDGDDIGMIEGGDSLGLPLETVAEVGVRRQDYGKDLQGDFAVQLAILGEEDLAHAPSADLRQDLVMRKRPAHNGLVVHFHSPSLCSTHKQRELMTLLKISFAVHAIKPHSPVVQTRRSSVRSVTRRGYSQLSNTEKNQEIAASKAGMDPTTARRYRDLERLPSELKKEREWRTREDPFSHVWDAVQRQVQESPRLEAKTLFEWLQREYPGQFSDGQIRTLQRRIKLWRLTEGPAQEVYFGQKHVPGRLCASDFTHMTELGITLAGQTFEHLVYHFVLTYSNWRLVCRKRPFRGRRIHVRPELIVRHF